MATTIFTDYGQQLITEAIANKTTINITKIAVGDGMGAIYTPVSTQTSLKRETWSGPIDSVQVNPTNKNQVIFEGIVGANVGGFYIREIGLYDQANKLVAISDFPESFKALADQYELYVRMILQTGSADVTNIIVSKDMIYATKKYVDTETAKKYSKPTNGIPKTDLTAAVQTSLEKADNAAPTTELAKTNQTVAAHQADELYQAAGGTATAITININGPLVNGYPMTFIASTNNSGAATTINGKKLYKPNTTIAPTLIAGKAYSIWYNQSSDCFFIKASADGSATSDKVLAGETFSNENDTGLTGAIPSKSAQTYTPGTSNQTIAANQFLSGIQTILGDPDLIASNIKKGINIFGVIGTLDVASLGGRMFASGTVLATGSVATVTGLAFTPSFAFGWMTETDTLNPSTYVQAFLMKSTNFAIGSNSYNRCVLTYHPSGGPKAYYYNDSNVISNGFSCRTDRPQNYNWIAFG